MAKDLVKKFNRQVLKDKVLELISDEAAGWTYNQIATKLGVSVQFVTDSLKEELASATTPEKIVELREHQVATLSVHTPRLHKRFLTQDNLAERLARKYEGLITEEDQGMYSFGYLFQMYKTELIAAWPETYPDKPEIDMAKVEAHAREYAREEIAAYRSRREQIAREMERTIKLGNDNFQTLVKLQERLAKLTGIDMPTQHSLLIHRSDELKIDLEMDIKNAQKRLEAKQPVLDAEVVEEESLDGQL